MGSEAIIRILDPRAEPEATASEAPIPALQDLSDKVVSLLSNEYPYLTVIWPRLMEILANRYQVAQSPVVKFPAATAPPPGLLEEVAKTSDAVIVALAN